MDALLDAACEWMAARPWTLAVILAVAIVFVGSLEVPA